MAEVFTRYAEERKYFSESAAILHQYKANPRLKTIDLYRFFRTSRPDLIVSSLEMLDKFTSAANWESIESDTAIDYVDNPMVGRNETKSGRFRLVSNTRFQDPRNPSEQGILQHLRLYRVTSILTDAALDFTLARVIEHDASRGNTTRFDELYTQSADDAKLFILEWAAVHPSKVADVVQEFSDNFGPTLSFTVDGQSFTGLDYIFAAVSDDTDEGDGSKKVAFTVGRHEFCLKYQGNLRSMAPYTGYLIWDIPKDGAQTLIDQVIAHRGQGISIFPEYSEGRHTVSMRLRVRDTTSGYAYSFPGSASCMEAAEITLYEGYTKDALVALLNALAGQVSSGVWYTVSEITEDKEDGLFSCTVIKHTAVEVAQPAHVTELSPLGVGVTERLFQATSNSGKLPLPAATQGYLYRRQVQKNENCTEDVTRMYSLRNAARASVRTGLSALGSSDALLYVASRTKIDAVHSERGGIYRATDTLGEDGTYDGRLEYAYSHPYTHSAVTADSAVSQELSAVYRNSRALVAAPDAVQGSLYRAGNTLNEDGTYDGQYVAANSKEHTLTHRSGSSLLGDEQTTLYGNIRTAIHAPSAGAGLQYSARLIYNEDGTYSGQVTGSRELAANTDMFQSAASCMAKEFTALYSGQSGPLVAPENVNGGVYQTQSTLSRSGSYEGRIVYRGSIPKDFLFLAAMSEMGSAYAHIYRNASTQVRAPDSLLGGLYRADNTLNDDCTYDGRVLYQGSTPKSIRFLSEDTLRTRKEVSLYENWRTAVAASDATVGGLYSAVNTINEDGSYRGNLAYIGSTPGDLYVYWRTRGGIAGMYQKWNYREDPQAFLNAFGQYTRNSVNIDPNPDKTYDVKVDISPSGLGATLAPFNFVSESVIYSRQKSVERYDSSTQKYIIQNWLRYVGFFKNYSSAVAKVPGILPLKDAAEKVSIILQNMGPYGYFWRLQYFVREGAAEGYKNTDGTDT